MADRFKEVSELVWRSTLANDECDGQLIPFLRDRNPEVRRLALSNLISQTPKDSPYRNIFLADSGGLGQKENDIINDLKLLCRDQLVSQLQLQTWRLDEHPTLVDCSRCLPSLGQPLRLAFGNIKVMRRPVSNLPRVIHHCQQVRFQRFFSNLTDVQ